MTDFSYQSQQAATQKEIKNVADCINQLHNFYRERIQSFYDEKLDETIKCNFQ